MTARDTAGKHTPGLIEAASEALSDLNTFAVVVSIMEGGHLHAPSYAASFRIINICRAEMGKRLREYDRAIAKSTPLPEAGKGEKL